MKVTDGWPLTDEGVPDWESAFEDEKNGLICMVVAAQTPVHLKQCTTVIIQKLFIRDDDVAQIMKNILALGEIIPDELEKETDKAVIDKMRGDIATLLRNIKKERIQNSQKYLRRKAEEKEARRISD